MIIIMMRLYSKTVLHVRARVGARVCAFVCVYSIIYAGAMCAYVYGYVCAYVFVRTCRCMRMCVQADERSRVRALVPADVCAYVSA